MDTARINGSFNQDLFVLYFGDARFEFDDIERELFYLFQQVFLHVPDIDTILHFLC